jgi:2-methylcitrate dehydratase
VGEQVGFGREGEAMSLRRDIAWEQFDLQQKSSLSFRFANYALGLKYDMLPAQVVHQAKRCLLDTLGCALGAYDAPGRSICEDTIKEIGGTPEATVFGSGMRTSAANANLINCFMVRFLDSNDLGGGGHNSDSIPSILAISERHHIGGQEFLTSVVTSYELGARVTAGATNWNGWLQDGRAGLTVPPAIGRLMGMSAEQIANAIGICVAGNSILSILDTPAEERVMRKNIRFGWNASAAITATLLARNGFTGPLRVFEGEKGMNEVMFKGEANPELMTDFRGWLIMNTHFKYLTSVVSCHGMLQATLEIVRENDLKPEDIAQVKVKTYPAAAAIRPTVPIVYPRNAETADHSAYYLTAIAIRDREVTEDSVNPENFADPVILDLIDKIVVEGDPAIKPPPKTRYISAEGFEGKSEITTKDGRKFERRVVVPHGFWGDPLTDAELEQKFTRMASKRLSETRVAEIIDTVWNVDRLDDMGKLARLMIFESN